MDQQCLHISFLELLAVKLSPVDIIIPTSQGKICVAALWQCNSSHILEEPRGNQSFKVATSSMGHSGLVQGKRCDLECNPHSREGELPCRHLVSRSEYSPVRLDIEQASSRFGSFLRWTSLHVPGTISVHYSWQHFLWKEMWRWMQSELESDSRLCLSSIVSNEPGVSQGRADQAELTLIAP